MSESEHNFGLSREQMDAAEKASNESSFVRKLIGSASVASLLSILTMYNFADQNDQNPRIYIEETNFNENETESLTNINITEMGEDHSVDARIKARTPDKVSPAIANAATLMVGVFCDTDTEAVELEQVNEFSGGLFENSNRFAIVTHPKLIEGLPELDTCVVDTTIGLGGNYDSIKIRHQVSSFADDNFDVRAAGTISADIPDWAHLLIEDAKANEVLKPLDLVTMHGTEGVIIPRTSGTIGPEIGEDLYPKAKGSELLLKDGEYVGFRTKSEICDSKLLGAPVVNADKINRTSNEAYGIIHEYGFGDTCSDIGVISLFGLRF